MTDQIFISGIRAVGVVGESPEDLNDPQPLEIDIVIDVNWGQARSGDYLGDTVHYAGVAEQVIAVVEQSKGSRLARIADRVADLVLSFSRTEAIEVTITKLSDASVGEGSTSAVKIHRTRADAHAVTLPMHIAVIGLGSNLGDRESFLRAAVNGLGPTIATSQVYETDPIGGPGGQGAYLNMVIEIETSLDPFALLRRCQRIEAQALRERAVKWGPRTLDIDLLFYDDSIIQTRELTVPHPELHERRFVLAPLREVAPDRCPEGWDDALEFSGVYPLGPLSL